MKFLAITMLFFLLATKCNDRAVTQLTEEEKSFIADSIKLVSDLNLAHIEFKHKWDSISTLSDKYWGTYYPKEEDRFAELQRAELDCIKKHRKYNDSLVKQFQVKYPSHKSLKIVFPK